MPLGKVRDKVVQGIARASPRPHRYAVRRWSIAVGLAALVAAIPACGILRIDLWGGRHVSLGHEVGLVEAAKRFAFPFLAINVAIVVVTRFFGRYLCGFGCPYGALARLDERLRFRARKALGRWAARLAVLAASASGAVIAFAYWVDFRVFRDGSPAAVAVASALLAGTTAAGYATVRGLGLGFCRDWCPSGVYFALLGHETRDGVELAHPEACTDCGACTRSCPIDLEPRELAGPPCRASTGLYGEAMSNHALCIRCGDCIVACEATTAGSGGPTPLRMGWLAAPEPEGEG